MSNEAESQVRSNDGDEVNLTPTQRRWLRHIRRCDEEGLSFQVYCTREGLGVKGMYAARKTLVSKGCLPAKNVASSPPPRFAAVRLSRPNAAVTLEALLPNQVQVRLSCDNASDAARLIESLARL